jgi:hypothetical protein
MKNLFYIAVIAVLVAGCGKEEKEEKQYDIALSAEELAIHYDETAQLDIVHIVEDTENFDFVFTSSDTNIVKVDNDGMVYGVAVGEATITLTANGHKCSANCGVKIVPYSTLFEEPFFRYDATYSEVKSMLRPEDILRDMGTNKDIYVKWKSPVDSIRFNFNSNKFYGTSLYIDLSDDDKFNEALLFLTERYSNGKQYEIRDRSTRWYYYRNAHKLNAEVGIAKGSAQYINIVYAVIFDD